MIPAISAVPAASATGVKFGLGGTPGWLNPAIRMFGFRKMM